MNLVGLLKTRLAAEVQGVADRIRSDVSVYRVKDSNILLQQDQDEDAMTCRDLLQHIHREDLDDRQRKKLMADPSSVIFCHVYCIISYKHCPT